MRKLILSFVVAFVVTLFQGTAFAESNTVSMSTMSVINSDTLPGNLLPNFMFQQGSIEGGSVGVKIGGGRGTPKPFSPDDSCGDDIFDGAMTDMRSPQLPYLTQDLWTCDRKQEDIPVIYLENDDLKVSVTPQIDGKVWGIYDKKRQQEWLFANRAHQPANIGALKSWAAGGAEWNWSPGIIGHSAFSETQVHVTKIHTKRGPLLRVFEYDRYNGTVWQVDMMIANGTFLAHPRITNPTDVDLRGYWWTCVAVESRPTTRIFAPATHVAETSRDPMRNAPWPIFAEAIENSTFGGYENAFPTDNSYLGNHQIGDMFLRIPDTVYTPYIAHTQEDGFVLVHGHPLNGTKFFTWGQSGPGRFMQDFLAGGGKRQGDYTELQVGPAPTQMQNFPVPRRSVREWTEWFRGFQGRTSVLRGSDYNLALSHIDSWIRSTDGMTREQVADWDHFFQREIEGYPGQVRETLVVGQPWGALEELRLGQKLAPGLDFQWPEKDSLNDREVRPWKELLTQGEFSDDTLKHLPLSYMTTDAWYDMLIQYRQRLESSGKSINWLLAYHLGVGMTERGVIKESQDLFATSLKLQPNPLAARCLAVLQSSNEAAWPFYQQAWSLALSRSTLQGFAQDSFADEDWHRLTANLVVEISFFLQQMGDYHAMAEFAATVPQAHRGYDAFLTLLIKVDLYSSERNYARAKSVLASECFPTYAKARSDLMTMWNDAVMGLAQDAKGALPLTNVEKHQARVNNRIPDNIGCQYASEYCTNYW